jgi:hypothetical protein
MWCPQCKSEYVDGIMRCPECGADLVEELPEEHDEPLEPIQWEELLFTHNQGDIAIIKSLLDEAGIIYYFQGDIVSVTRAWVDPARLYIKKEDIPKAKILLEDFL